MKGLSISPSNSPIPLSPLSLSASPSLQSSSAAANTAAAPPPLSITAGGNGGGGSASASSAFSSALEVRSNQRRITLRRRPSFADEGISSPCGSGACDGDSDGSSAKSMDLATPPGAAVHHARGVSSEKLGTLGSPGLKRSASTFFRRNNSFKIERSAPVPVRPSLSSLSASASSSLKYAAPSLQQQQLQLQQQAREQELERRTPGGLKQRALNSLSLPRRSKRNVSAGHARPKASGSAGGAGAPRHRGPCGGGGPPLVECFFVVTAGDLAGDVEERLEEIRQEDPEAPSRLVIDPLAVAYSGAVAAVCPDRGWETLAPSVWMFCAPGGLFLASAPGDPEVFPFVMTAENGEKRYVTCLRHYALLPYADAAALYDRCGHDARGDAGVRPLYAPRIYCVSATVPCYTFCREWLCRVHALEAGLGGEAFSLEAAVAYLLGVPAPLVGGAPLRAALDGRPMREVRLPPQEDYPQYLDVPLRLLFQMLSVDDVLLIFRSLLVEEKVLLLSKTKTVLTYVEEALTALMWPLRWSCIQISILPHQLSDFMSGPIVYLIGISKSGPGADDGLQSALPDDALVVDLDRGAVTLPKSAAARAALPPLPDESRCELAADLEEFTTGCAAGADLCGWQPWRSAADFNLGVRAAFLRSIVGLVRGYRESCRYIRVFPRPQMAIDEDLFARSAGKRKHPFYEAFSRSQALVGFLEAHKWPRENLFDTILEANIAGEPWAQSAFGIKEYLRSIEEGAASEECITAELRLTLPEEEAAEKRRRDEEEGNAKKGVIDADAVEVMELPAFVTVPERESAMREERRLSQKERRGDGISGSDEGRPFVPRTSKIEDGESGGDGKDSLGLYEIIADAIVNDKAGSVNEDMTKEIFFRLSTRAGRTMFSEALLNAEVEGTRKGREIQLSVDSCQVLGTLLHRALEMAHMEDDIISPQLLFQVGSTFYNAVNGDLVLLLLKGAKIWNEQRFWETLFYKKAHEECAKLYPPSIFEEMTKWDEKSDSEKEKIENREVQALWKLLSDFCKYFNYSLYSLFIYYFILFYFILLAYKMSLLELPSTFFKKFCMKMASMTHMDNEHLNTLSVLIKNMEKLNKISDPPEKQ